MALASVYISFTEIASLHHAGRLDLVEKVKREKIVTVFFPHEKYHVPFWDISPAIYWRQLSPSWRCKSGSYSLKHLIEYVLTITEITFFELLKNR